MGTVMVSIGGTMVNTENSEALERLGHRLLLELGETDGYAALKMIFEELGGLRVTVPTIKELERQERDRMIIEAFTGFNYHELAIRFKCSVRTIRRIVCK